MALPSPSRREAWWELDSKRLNKSYLCLRKGASKRDSNGENVVVLLTELAVAEAGGGVVVDHADGLHERVADGGADEAEATFFHVFAYGVGHLGGGWKSGMSFP